MPASELVYKVISIINTLVIGVLNHTVIGVISCFIQITRVLIPAITMAVAISIATSASAGLPGTAAVQQGHRRPEFHQ